ncbi:NAD(P)-binding Rossmann-fold containing protein [Glarea lozoyensis ATCC 20868]|uniref:NAD(P)-binding Rossmann-fold containing protein n=1 Tax=Glarea lozoyensis (strain ATCC 20868 / MF5171) TaxID=1116229 RepID=S3E3E4_GLAL2|nr:NAD(P)-binding Rossmann-fold containing protein [Glarea lozoyensis ATCC 20868]EPE32963.1 NAD(P)-binding Rossmann-fold containing protein [Glarea lozoyensis ATCC 20868]
MSQSYQIFPTDAAKSHLSPTFLNNLHLKTTPIPTPGPNSVLLRIRAVSLNYRDLLIVANSPLYPVSAVPGLIPCCDGAGEIVSVGENSKWASNIGASVIVHPTHSWIDGNVSNYDFATTRGMGDIQGLLAQYVVIEDEWIVLGPKNLSFEEMASLPCAGATAVNVLSSVNVEKGTTVVTQGTGGVSCFVIQFASALGATVISTSSSAAKLAIAQKLGATHLINYNTSPSWSEDILRLTDNRGVDLVADVGGSGTIGETIKSLRQGGTACCIGFLAPPKEVDVVFDLMFKARTLKGVICFSRKMVEDMVVLVEEHDIHPPIEVYEWEDAKKAFEIYRDQKVVGKVVIKV